MSCRVNKIFRAIGEYIRVPIRANVDAVVKLGCKIEVPSVTDRSRLGLPKDDTLDRRAFLRVPLSFPKARRGRAQRG